MVNNVAPVSAAAPGSVRAQHAGADGAVRPADEPEPPDTRAALTGSTSPRLELARTVSTLSSGGSSSATPPSPQSARGPAPGARSARVLQPHTLSHDRDALLPHILSADAVLAALDSNADAGLTPEAAAARLAANGPNTIRESKKVSAGDILLRQVANALTVILLAAMALSFGVRDWVEGAVVAVVILVNVAIGFVQEWRAEQTMNSLRTLSAPTSTVLRAGALITVPSRELVLGDVIVFSAGDLLPADVRLIAPLVNLEVDEASLTGESVPVAKMLDALDDGADLGPADRINLAYAGTVVTKGRGRGVVCATGATTQLGVIAAAMDTRAERRAAQAAWPWYRRVWEAMARFLGLRDGTPLQIKLSLFALVLLGLAILCVIIVFSVATFDLTDETILYAVALAIGVLPESLIAVLSICFAAGASRMAKSGVIVRRLEALEALGGVDVICSDKTGTLTLGKMVVREAWLPSNDSADGHSFGVDHDGPALEPVGQVFQNETRFDAGTYPPAMHGLVEAASLCNVATLAQDDAGTWSGRGDPTELALQVFAHKCSLGRPSLTEGNDAQYTLAQEHPFDSATKRMTSMYRSRAEPDVYRLFMKGGLDRVLECCTGMKRDDATVPLDDALRADIRAQMQRMASKGLRVLAFAQRRVNVADIDDTKDKKEARSELMTRTEAECHFDFVALAGLYDPPRPETAGAVATCHTAGISVIMVTGDEQATAHAIALQVGILPDLSSHSAAQIDALVTNATRFDALSDDDIDALESLPLVIARCTPQTKVRLIKAARRRGMRGAMTGDGVNDAPALKNADIGVAMGSGTDIAKDSSALIITDDCFSSITEGIRQGRCVFDSIKKFLVALLVVNVAEVILLLIGLALRDKSPDPESIFPIAPLGILFLNLLVGLPAIGLGFELPQPDLMRRAPSKESAFSRQVIADLFVYGSTMGVLCLAVFVAMIYGVHGGELGIECNETLHEGSATLAGVCDGVFEARAATFSTLFFQAIFITWELLSIEESFFTLSPVKRLKQNPFLLWSVVVGIAIVPFSVYVPGWRDVLKHAPMKGAAWGLTIAGVVIFLAVVEAWKLLARRGRWAWLTRVSGGGDGAQWRKMKAAEAAEAAAAEVPSEKA